MTGESRQENALRRGLRGTFWGALAALAAASAYQAVQTPEGTERLARAHGEIVDLAAAVQGVRESEVTLRIAAEDRAILAVGGETARLAEELGEVRRAASMLARTQTQAQERIAALEAQLGTITGSIGKQDRRPPPLPPLSMFEPDIAAPDAGRFELMPVGSEMAMALRDAQPMAQVMRTPFAVALSDAADVAGLEAAWRALRRDHMQALGALRPFVLIDRAAEGTRLTLLAGPLRNAQEAAAICVALAGAQAPCRTVAMSGSVLALNVQSQ